MKNPPTLSPHSREVDFVLVVWSNAVLTTGLGERFAWKSGTNFVKMEPKMFGGLNEKSANIVIWQIYSCNP